MNAHRFKSILILLILNAVYTNFAEGQIVYGTVDTALGLNSLYRLDVNNDETFDFEFSTSYLAYGRCGEMGPGTASSEAKVSGTADGFQILNFLGFPAALNANDTIQDNSYWTGAYAARLLQVYWSCGNGSTLSGNWQSPTDHYLPIRFYLNRGWCYGWIRIMITQGIFGRIAFTVKDFAYNSIPDSGLLAGQTSALGVDGIPLSVEWSVFPNPVIHSAFIKFVLLNNGPVSIKLYDLNGKLVQTIADEVFERGAREVGWNVDRTPEGIYFIKIRTEGYSKVEKVIISK
jgi:hypothetical protein